MEKEQDIEVVKKKFTDYLSQKGFRKTVERFAILEIIYSDTKHFSREMLQKALTIRVSRATLYNTLQLLQECNLVLKHQFGKKTFYERAFKNDFHLHLNCTVCSTTRELKDNDFKKCMQNKKLINFTPFRYSLNIYGICNKCSLKEKRKKFEKKKLEEAKNCVIKINQK